MSDRDACQIHNEQKTIRELERGKQEYGCKSCWADDVKRIVGMFRADELPSIATTSEKRNG